jgi:hypothetical protein
MNQIEKLQVTPKEYGLDDDQALELVAGLPQIIEERILLEEQYNAIIKMDIEDPITWKKAKDARVLIQKNRTQGLIVWHKASKEFFLRGGQFVDALKRKHIVVNERMEQALMEIEKYPEIQEKKRLDKIQAERVALLSPYVEDAEQRVLSTMEEDVWKAYLETKKIEYLNRIEAEKKEKELQLLKEKEEAEQLEKVRIENEKLKKAADLERKKREKLEAELNAKKKEEADLLKKEADLKKKEAASSDKEKLQSLIVALKHYPLPEVNSEEAKHILLDVKLLLSYIANHINIKITTL